MTRDEKAKARDTVLRLLKFRPRSEQEVQAKLKAKKISDETITQTIQYFKQLQLIDDHQFAKSWITARLARPFGINRIRFELKIKGVNDEIIKELLNEINDPDAQWKAVLTLAEKRSVKYKNLEPRKAKRRIFEYLSRRGFSPDTILKVMRELSL
mgnify:CR=1 FL=1